MALVEQPLLVDPRSAELKSLVRHVTADEDAARRLMARFLLHLPRLADPSGRVLPADALGEVEWLAQREADAPDWLRPPPRPPTSPRDLVPTELDLDRARAVHRRFHYLRSYRQGLHVAGVAADRMAVLLTFSPLDLSAVRSTLPRGLRSGDALVLSRAYSTAWAPRNSLSWMLAQATRLLGAASPNPRIVLTYLNPGIGFDGASYKAANWCLYGREHGTRYAYVDGVYTTDRELTARFGSSAAAALEETLGERIAFSSMSLPPLEMYAYPLDRRLQGELTTGPRHWARPWA